MFEFPETLYVGIENEGTEDEFRNTATDIGELAMRGGNRVGIYRLEKTIVADLKLETSPEKARGKK